MDKQNLLKIFLILLGIVIISVTGYTACKINKDVEKITNINTAPILQSKNKTSLPSQGMSNDSQVPTYLPRVVELVRQNLAERLNIASSNIEIVQLKAVVWPDTCLGLPAPELCVPGETPGYQVILRALGGEFRYHTDKEETFRFAGPGDVPRPP